MKLAAVLLRDYFRRTLHLEVYDSNRMIICPSAKYTYSGDMLEMYHRKHRK